MLKHYIEYLHPGSFVAENSEAPVPMRALPAQIPQRVAGYRFFSRTEIECEGEKLIGQRRDVSPWTYFGKSYTVDDLAKEVGTDSILYGNIALNGYAGAVRTIFGNWYPLNAGESVALLPESK